MRHRSISLMLAAGCISLAAAPSLLAQEDNDRAIPRTEDGRAMLDVAAVIGHEVHLDLWQCVSETTDQDLGECLRVAIDANVLSEWSIGRSVRFTHALFREAVYAGIVVTRRRNLHQRIANVLLETPDPDPDAVAR
jgi:hypothetical protein